MDFYATFSRCYREINYHDDIVRLNINNFLKIENLVLEYLEKYLVSSTLHLSKNAYIKFKDT